MTYKRKLAILIAAAILIDGGLLLRSFADDVPTVPGSVPLKPVVEVVPTSPVVKLSFDGGWCSGFYIGNDRFITAGHCEFQTGRPVAFTAHPDQGDDFQVEPVFASDTAAGPIGDYMIVQAVNPVPADWKPDTLDCAYTPALGDTISTYGYPAGIGDGPIFAQGYVSGLSRLIEPGTGGWEAPVYVVTMPIFGGHSGSPSYHNGKVVGITVGSDPNQQGWAVIQPIQPVCTILSLLYNPAPAGN